MYDPRTRVASHHGGDHHSYGYGYANRERKVGLSYEGCINWLGESNGDRDSDDQEEVVHLRPETLQGISDDEYGFGFCASPLWQDSPSPPRSPSQPLLAHSTHRSCLPSNSRVQAIARGQKELHNAYRSLSPNSRVQAIVRGQRELMEMVKNMPESSYELSLKDLVENDKVENQNQSPDAQEDRPGSGNNNTGSGVKVGQKSDNKNNLRRSGSFEQKGLFLKMGLPVISLQKRSNSGGNTTNNNNNITGGIGKAPPKPVIGERDWWKKKFTGSSDSDSSRTSNNSGSTRSTSSSSRNSSCYNGSSRRKKEGFFGGCWPFFQSRRKYA